MPYSLNDSPCSVSAMRGSAGATDVHARNKNLNQEAAHDGYRGIGHCDVSWGNTNQDNSSERLELESLGCKSEDNTARAR